MVFPETRLDAPASATHPRLPRLTGVRPFVKCVDFCQERGTDLRLRRYRGRHLKRRPLRRGPVVVGTAAAVWAGGPAEAATHVVAPGETLSGIAQRYRTSVSVLARANHLSDPDLIVVGERLRIPGRVTPAATHVVRPGETLSSIAARYGASVRALVRANHIRDADLIVAGSVLRVPGNAAGHQAAGGGVGVALEEEARARELDSSLVKAVAWQESRWRQDAVSSSGAVGVMQVMPETADYVNRSLGGGDLDPASAEDNVRLGVIYLDHLLERMPSERKALAAYYSGPGAVGRRLERYQRRYVRGVQALKPRF